ncbi:hypothetical protein FALBO_3362 [Fusarium albosuccineum]|uniref:Uncharacterized protein n=1 Tax=Fusarium albosuccineum TaxID=1237068 RepID=A0A8H4PH84_9HYPO|nr:hypothetical protein FALBO_3362 [Fusarium albosuccineum]
MPHALEGQYAGASADTSRVSTVATNADGTWRELSPWIPQQCVYEQLLEKYDLGVSDHFPYLVNLHPALAGRESTPDHEEWHRGCSFQKVRSRNGHFNNIRQLAASMIDPQTGLEQGAPGNMAARNSISILCPKTIPDPSRDINVNERPLLLGDTPGTDFLHKTEGQDEPQESEGSEKTPWKFGTAIDHVEKRHEQQLHGETFDRSLVRPGCASSGLSPRLKPANGVTQHPSGPDGDSAWRLPDGDSYSLLANGTSLRDIKKLPRSRRRRVLRQHLVGNEPLVIQHPIDGAYQHSIRYFAMLKEKAGGDEFEQRILRDARQMFYEENVLIVFWDGLVNALVRRITVKIGRREFPNGRLVEALGHLSALSNLANLESISLKWDVDPADDSKAESDRTLRNPFSDDAYTFEKE